MTEKQHQQIEKSYDSLQNEYQALMEEYQTGSDTLSSELQNLYAEMQQMHQQMKASHRQMMDGMMKRHMKEKGMMKKGMGMQMRGQMTSEWYQQMISMHNQMARLHKKMGHSSMARMNRQLSRKFETMQKSLPAEQDKSTSTAANGEDNLSRLNGASLFTQNCASCHGRDGQGYTGAFPPLVNSKWITAEKSIPIRIVLHGLTGEMIVNNQTYRGSMPSFRTRLGDAETAAILNYLRSESTGSQPKITTDDVKQIRETYSGRNRPWTARELSDSN